MRSTRRTPLAAARAQCAQASRRAVALAGAFALVVLLAVAGVPAAAAAAIAPTAVELVDGHGGRLVPAGVPARAAVVRTPLPSACEAAAPRLPAHVLRLAEGGLPGPRAPSV